MQRSENCSIIIRSRKKLRSMQAIAIFDRDITVKPLQLSATQTIPQSSSPSLACCQLSGLAVAQPPQLANAYSAVAA